MLCGSTQRIGIGGARGGGKTGGALVCLILYLSEHPNLRALLLRRTYVELYRQHILEAYRLFPHLMARYKSQQHELPFPNGSKLFFGSAEHEQDMSHFYGLEFAIIVVDEAQEFKPEELERLYGSNRCTSNPDIVPKTVMTFMPGLTTTGLPPVGLDYLVRTFVKGELNESERSVEWGFVPAFAWDNAYWVTKELQRDGFNEHDFYSWTEEARKAYYLASDYGRQLLSISDPQLRDAWLYGKWDVFEGQYFPQFKRELHVYDATMEIPAHWHRWISGDWGEHHPACFHWHAVDEKGHVWTYREWWERGIGERNMGLGISQRSIGEDIEEFYLSADVFGKIDKKTRKPLTLLIGDALSPNIRKPTPCDQASGTRIAGWRLMAELLSQNRWKISSQCEHLIRQIPRLKRDMERSPEDVLKVDYSASTEGDDAADCARYGLQMGLARPSVPSIEMAAHRKVIEYAESRGRDVEELEPTSYQQLSRRALIQERIKRHKRRGGLGRIWRPQVN